MPNNEMACRSVIEPAPAVRRLSGYLPLAAGRINVISLTSIVPQAGGQDMRVIGITGGVGSGKSLVAEMLAEEYQAGLLITDELGHRVMEPGMSGYRQVIDAFGEDIIGEDGHIDRQKLADRIFGDDTARERLNAIIHPSVISYVEGYIAERKGQDGLLVLESALLFESGCDRLCDSIWYIRVSEALRRKRLADSRGYPVQKTEAIMKRQLREDEFLQRSNVVIENQGSVEELQEAVRRAVLAEK